MLRSATARGLVYTTSTFESGGTENKILTLSPGRENHQNRPHRDELGLEETPMAVRVAEMVGYGEISGLVERAKKRLAPLSPEQPRGAVI